MTLRNVDRVRFRGDRPIAMAIGALAAVVAILLVVTALAFETLSSARAYAAGEAMWSKAEKSGVAQLLRFAHTRNEGDYEAFVAAMQVPLADRRARLEMEKPDPDMDVVRDALLAGGNHPADHQRMYGFYRRFRRTPQVAGTVEVWEAADREIAALMEDGARLRAALAGAADEATVRHLLDEIHARAARLTQLETRFAVSMGENSRWAQRILFGVLAGVAFLLLVVASFFVRGSVRRAIASDVSFRQSEEKKQTVLDTIEDGYYELNVEGGFTSANAGLCRILGREAHEILGHHLCEFVDPQSEGMLLGLLARVRQTGAAVREARALVLRPDGAHRTVECSATLLAGADGQATGFCGVARDVTERRHQEEALRRSESEYRGLFEHAPYGIYRCTTDGRLLAVNDALVAMLGYQSSDQLMATHTEGGSAASEEQRQQLISAYLHMDVVADVEAEWRRSDGSSILVRLNGRKIREEEGFEGFEIFVEDLTQRRGLELQLRQAQKMQAVGQLTGGIAHDFNNLLTIIASTADLLAEDLEVAPPGVHADIQTMRAAADRGAEMVRKLLAFSRRGQLRVTPVDLGSIVTDTVAMMRRILPAHIEIAADVETPGPIVNADRGALEQILLNLATNARDAMQQGGTLRIQVNQTELDAAFCAARGGGSAGNYAMLVVSDTGIGMDEQTREHAFEPFFTTKAPGAGTGLGMAMIYGLVRQHEGFISLHSTPGVGTTVTIYLPASADAPDEAGAAHRNARPRGHETILLVEDEFAILGTGKRILERHGYTVWTASNGEEAMAIVRARGGEIDLILSDVVMPRMGGGVLHRAVMATGLKLRFLFTSGYTQRDVGGMLDPDVPLVPKPWSVDELVRSVRQALDAPPPSSAAELPAA